MCRSIRPQPSRWRSNLAGDHVDGIEAVIRSDPRSGGRRETVSCDNAVRVAGIDADILQVRDGRDSGGRRDGHVAVAERSQVGGCAVGVSNGKCIRRPSADGDVGRGFEDGVRPGSAFESADVRGVARRRLLRPADAPLVGGAVQGRIAVVDERAAGVHGRHGYAGAAGAGVGQRRRCDIEARIRVEPVVRPGQNETRGAVDVAVVQRNRRPRNLVDDISARVTGRIARDDGIVERVRPPIRRFLENVNCPAVASTGHGSRSRDVARNRAASEIERAAEGRRLDTLYSMMAPPERAVLLAIVQLEIV